MKKVKISTMNRKAAIPSGIVWIPATIIIFFIMVGYLTALGVTKIKGGGNEIGVEGENKVGIAATNSFIVFLNSDTEIENEKIKIKALFIREETEKITEELNKKIIAVIQPECYIFYSKEIGLEEYDLFGNMAGAQESGTRRDD